MTKYIWDIFGGHAIYKHKYSLIIEAENPSWFFRRITKSTLGSVWTKQ